MAVAEFLRHPDYLARLAAVLADPADDGPRLVAADWLDERPENAARLYAEFIRVQVEAAALAAEGQSPPSAETEKCNDARCKPCRLWRLYRRERELVYRHAADEWVGLPALPDGGRWWCENLSGVNPEVVPRALFRRGFVDAVTCTADAWLTRAGAILAVQPVREVTLTDLPGNRAGRSWQGWRDGVHAALKARWGDIDFRLPDPPGGREQPRDLDDNPIDHEDALGIRFRGFVDLDTGPVLRDPRFLIRPEAPDP